MVRKRSMSLFQPSVNSTAKRLEGIEDSDDNDIGDDKFERASLDLKYDNGIDRIDEFNEVEDSGNEDIGDGEEMPEYADEEIIPGDKEARELDGLNLTCTMKRDFCKALREQIPQIDTQTSYYRMEHLDYTPLAKILNKTCAETKSFLKALVKKKYPRTSLYTKSIEFETHWSRVVKKSLPKRPGSAFCLFISDQKEAIAKRMRKEGLKEVLPNRRVAAFAAIAKQMFTELSEEERAKIDKIRESRQAIYKIHAEKYKEKRSSLKPNKINSSKRKTPIQLYYLSLIEKGEIESNAPISIANKKWQKDCPIAEKVKFIQMAYSEYNSVDSETTGVAKKYVAVMKSFDKLNVNKSLEDEKEEKRKRQAAKEKAKEIKRLKENETAKEKLTPKRQKEMDANQAVNKTKVSRDKKKKETDKTIQTNSTKRKKLIEKQKPFKSAEMVEDSWSESEEIVKVIEADSPTKSPKKSKKRKHQESTSETEQIPVSAKKSKAKQPKTVEDHSEIHCANISKTADNDDEGKTKPSKKKDKSRVNEDVSEPHLAKKKSKSKSMENDSVICHTDNETGMDTTARDSPKKIKKEIKTEKIGAIEENISRIQKLKPPKTIKKYFINTVCKGKAKVAESKWAKYSKKRKNEIRANYSEACDIYIKNLRSYLKTLKEEKVAKASILLKCQAAAESEDDDDFSQSDTSDDEDDE